MDESSSLLFCGGQAWLHQPGQVSVAYRACGGVPVPGVCRPRPPQVGWAQDWTRAYIYSSEHFPSTLLNGGLGIIWDCLHRGSSVTPRPTMYRCSGDDSIGPVLGPSFLNPGCYNFDLYHSLWGCNIFHPPLWLLHLCRSMGALQHIEASRGGALASGAGCKTGEQRELRRHDDGHEIKN